MDTRPKQAEFLDEHYQYELDQLSFVHKLLNDPDISHASQLFKNMLINAFCLHARSLWEFFAKRSQKKIDDARITDFMPDFQSGLPYPKNGEDLWDRINKQISHLTYSRGTNKIDDGDRHYLYKLIIADHDKFLACSGKIFPQVTKVEI